MYIVKGEGILTVNNKSRIIKENDVMLVNCHEPHIYKTDTYFETLWIHFHSTIIDDYYNLIRQDNTHVIFSESSLVLDYLKSIINLFKEGQIINEPLISCDIQRILAELFNLSNGNHKSTSVTQSSVNNSINFIKRNFKNKLSLNDIATNISMSPFHFCRIFKKEIAFECGFNNESNFVITLKNILI